MSLFVLGNDFVTMSLTTELAPPIPRILLTLFALDPNFNSEFRILIVRGRLFQRLQNISLI